MQNTRLSIVTVLLVVFAAGAFASESGIDHESQVKRLSSELAAAMAENDALKARLDGRALGLAPSGLGGMRFAESGATVLDANPELGMVVVSAGGRQGVRAGMVLTVLRGKRALARVRVTDVRRRVSGAVVEEVLPGSPYPGPGDRLVVTTDGE